MIHAIPLTFILIYVVKYYSIAVYPRHIDLGSNTEMDGGREMEKKREY
jgi:hypothetical protein